MYRKNSKTKKAFTLLELIIAMALAAVIAAIIFTFFFSNYKSLDKTSKKSDLQLQASQINTLLNEKLMEAEKVESLLNSQNEELLDHSEASGPLILIYIDGDGKSNSIQITSENFISIDGDGNKKEIYAKISSVKVTTIIKGNTFKNATGLKLSFILGNETLNYAFESNAYFRNKSVEVK